MKIKIIQVLLFSIVFATEASHSAFFELHCPDPNKGEINYEASGKYSGFVTGTPLKILLKGTLPTKINPFEILKIEISPQNKLNCIYRTISGKLDCEMLTLSGSLDGLTNTKCSVKCDVKDSDKCVTKDNKCHIECTSHTYRVGRLNSSAPLAKIN